ncbi:MAG: UDP-2,4-diacetamido-2,4,6-trideoxy-beta-L-altropyranose hydrolase, partial [Candidimonas sp.]
LAQIRERADRMRHPTQVLVGVNDMARLMTDSDLAIGAAGGTSWERCCLGVPSLVLALADNQRGVAATLQDAGGAIAMQSAAEVATFLQDHLDAGTLPDTLRRLSAAASRITDGEGVSRVVRRMVP